MIVGALAGLVLGLLIGLGIGSASKDGRVQDASVAGAQNEEAQDDAVQWLTDAQPMDVMLVDDELRTIRVVARGRQGSGLGYECQVVNRSDHEIQVAPVEGTWSVQGQPSSVLGEMVVEPQKTANGVLVSFSPDEVTDLAALGDARGVLRITYRGGAGDAATYAVAISDALGVAAMPAAGDEALPVDQAQGSVESSQITLARDALVYAHAEDGSPHYAFNIDLTSVEGEGAQPYEQSSFTEGYAVALPDDVPEGARLHLVARDSAGAGASWEADVTIDSGSGARRLDVSLGTPRTAAATTTEALDRYVGELDVQGYSGDWLVSARNVEGRTEMRTSEETIPEGAVLGVRTQDLDGDLAPELFVCRWSAGSIRLEVYEDRNGEVELATARGLRDLWDSASGVPLFAHGRLSVATDAADGVYVQFWSDDADGRRRWDLRRLTYGASGFVVGDSLNPGDADAPLDNARDVLVRNGFVCDSFEPGAAMDPYADELYADREAAVAPVVSMTVEDVEDGEGKGWESAVEEALEEAGDLPGGAWTPTHPLAAFATE